MNRKETEQIVNEYLKKIYVVVLTKTANLQNAEDLTNTLLVQEVDNISAFIWCIVRDMLANYYRGKARSGIGVCIDEVAEGLIHEEDV